MRQAGVETMSRILSAAKTEFAQYGLAGTRINRIAANARASKDRLYSYFESKEDLYAEVLRKWMTTTAETTALAEDDVLGYVARLFDDYVANPENARLQQWAQLEITESLDPGDPRIVAARHAVGKIRAAQSAGYVDPSWDAAELLSMLTNIARVLALPERHPYLAGGGRPTAERRQAALEAARRLTETR
ncbi:TetR family transcriptional regulator [Gordonia sp. TBRC 11910]|uniref:TetR family transcriptional regulator n=1 Tax=Gordonia asplenii TaxID=2725283 RepID=A0A848KRR8_9ACTN|nr:TetR family transcriptional regulator [Gordonia asplenii]